MSKWRKLEIFIMEKLGARPTRGSGNTWLEKEDGESDTALYQLKCTEALQITLKYKDVEALINNARIVGKEPMFVLHFKPKSGVMTKPISLVGKVIENYEY